MPQLPKGDSVFSLHFLMCQANHHLTKSFSFFSLFTAVVSAANQFPPHFFLFSSGLVFTLHSLIAEGGMLRNTLERGEEGCSM